MGSVLAIPVEREAQPTKWSWTTRVAFRFCFVYFGVYCLCTQIITSFVPVPSFDVPDPSTFWPIRPIVFWTAAHIFRVNKPLVYIGSGSGDKTFDWVLLFCMLLLSVIVAVLWSALDRRRANYVRLNKWFRVFVRLCLAGQMMSYGMAKAVPLQMPFPYLTRLLEHFGDFSPMGVLWSSIGASRGYEIFAGCAELLGGVLLILPRTTTLGALVCLADMIQVFMLNMTYDVPVKLLSFHLILLSLFLLAPDFKRLADFFFLNRTAEPSAKKLLFATNRANRIAVAAQIVVGIWLLGMNAYVCRLDWYGNYGGGRTLPPLYGIWEVEEQTIDGQIRAPLLTDAGRWRRVIFDFPNRMTFQRIDESFAGHPVAIDEKNRTLVIADDKDKNWKANFTFTRPAPNQMKLDGTMDGHTVQMQLKQMDRNQFRLVSRGFHWIQEYPFNR
ncbi:MAG TPA: DoxX family protein [Verrucomicrobiae bacterium]|jgi:hypothetical protein|nr:DoxX family protein [Verrucomicrobiae bacterium]